MKGKIVLVFVSLISILVLTACTNNSDGGNQGSDLAQVTIDDLAQTFELKDLEGNTVIMKDLVGQPVYIKYWASWCSICLAGLDELNTLASENNDFTVISIVSPNFKGEMSTDKFKAWFDSLPQDNITVLLDEDGVWAKEFGVIAYPTSYYVGSYGVLDKTIVGHNTNDEIKKIMKNSK